MVVLQPVHFALVFSQLERNPQNHSFLHLVSGSDIKAQPALAQGVKLQINLLPVWLLSTISFVWWWWCDGEGIDNDMHIYADDEKMLSASGGWVCIEQLWGCRWRQHPTSHCTSPHINLHYNSGNHGGGDDDDDDGGDGNDDKVGVRALVAR